MLCAEREAFKSKLNGERQRDAEGYRLRAAGVCIRGEGSQMEVLLVSCGKDGERWVVPGGGVEKGEDASTAAKRELEEEAGVKGVPLEQLGVFQDDDRKHRTTVYMMLHQEELTEWEDGRIGRRRRWMSFSDALTMVKKSHVTVLHSVMIRVGIPVTSST